MPTVIPTHSPDSRPRRSGPIPVAQPHAHGGGSGQTTLNMLPTPHSATIVLEGKIANECGRELAAMVRVLRDEGFYDRVVLRITSPGGAEQCIHDYLREAPSFRVPVLTHVPFCAESAAAVLASLGDERTAAAGAALLYHRVSVSGGAGMTATAAHRLGETLADLDGRVIHALVDKAREECRRRRPGTGIRGLPASDWPVVARLLGDVASGDRRRDLALLRRMVGDAVADDRPDALRRLYNRLFQLDAHISAKLAAELRLIDRVGSPESVEGVARSDGGPCVTIPEWTALYSDGRVPRSDLCRHVLILGETGSGKTASGILPVVAALLDERNPVGVALVIDPKDEIGRSIATMRGGGPSVVHEIDFGRDTLNLAAGGHSVGREIAAGNVMTAANALLRRAASLDRGNPARTLCGLASPRRDPYWDVEGARLAETVLAFVLLVYRHATELFGTADSNSILARLSRHDDIACKALTALGERAGLVRRCGEGGVRCLDEPEPGPSALALAKDAIQMLFNVPPCFHVGAIAEVLRKDPGFQSGEVPQLLEKIISWWKPLAGVDRQYQGLLGMGGMCFIAFSDPVPSRVLRFGCEPGDAPPTIDFRDDVERDVGEGRTIYVVRAGLSRTDALVARAIKAAYFGAVLESPRRAERGECDMPLAAYVADEFHRFVTADEAHGEQSYVDTCRSFGGCCVLATQSVSSLRYALDEASASESAVDLLIANTATKLVFRSTEEGVLKLVERLCSDRAALMPFVKIRPPSTLHVGECYAALSDGRSERRQLAPYMAREAT